MQPIWHRNGQLRENGQNFVAREGSTIILKNVYNVYIFLELVAGVFATIIPPPSSLSLSLGNFNTRPGVTENCVA